jgi:hypothetical protein
VEVKEKYHFSFDQFDLGFSCMKVIYFDAFSGISGDMCLGALVDAGCPAEEIKLLLTQLQIPGFDLRWERVERGPLTGTKVHVMVEEEHHVHRHLRDILEITDRANFPGNVRETIEAVYTALAQAEGEVHGKPYDKIHFHEVGSFDAIVDISGTILALHLFGIEKVYCSRIHVGEGFASTHHGKLPIPVPATANLLRGFEIYSTGKTRELVTPTGAALMKVLAGSSTVLPAMLMQQVGYGAGTRNDQDLPNMLRVFAGMAISTPVSVVNSARLALAGVDCTGSMEREKARIRRITSRSKTRSTTIVARAVGKVCWVFCHTRKGRINSPSRAGNTPLPIKPIFAIRNSLLTETQGVPRKDCQRSARSHIATYCRRIAMIT